MVHKLSNKRWNKEIALVVFNMWRRLTAYKVEVSACLDACESMYACK